MSSNFQDERRSGNTIKINLLPEERRGWRLDPLVLILILLVLAGNVGFAFFGQQLSGRIEVRQAEVLKAQEEKKQVEASLPVIEERRARLHKLDQEISTVKSLVHDPIRYANLLQDLAFRLPKNAWLSSLSIEPGSNTVQISGTADAVPGSLPLATVSGLMESLNRSAYFKDAALSSTTQSGQGFSFQISTHYDPEAAANQPPCSDKPTVERRQAP